MLLVTLQVEPVAVLLGAIGVFKKSLVLVADQ